MSDEANGKPPADAAAASPGTEAPSSQPAPASEPRIDYKEIVGMRKEVREMTTLLSQLIGKQSEPADAGKAAKASPAPTGDAAAALAEVASLRFELGLRDAMSAAGIAGGPVAELITKAAKADKPADLAEYVAKYAALGRPAVAAPAAPVAPPIAPSNTGPPKGAGSDALSGDPRLWPADVVEKLSVENFRKAVKEYDEVAGGKQNPFARLRKR